MTDFDPNGAALTRVRIAQDHYRVCELLFREMEQLFAQATLELNEADAELVKVRLQWSPRPLTNLYIQK